MFLCSFPLVQGQSRKIGKSSKRNSHRYLQLCMRHTDLRYYQDCRYFHESPGYYHRASFPKLFAGYPLQLIFVHLWDFVVANNKMYQICRAAEGENLQAQNSALFHCPNRRCRFLPVPCRKLKLKPAKDREFYAKFSWVVPPFVAWISKFGRTKTDFCCFGAPCYLLRCKCTPDIQRASIGGGTILLAFEKDSYCIRISSIFLKFISIVADSSCTCIIHCFVRTYS